MLRMGYGLVAMPLLAAGLASFGVWAQGKAPKPPKHPRTDLVERRALVRPAAEGELKLTPTYTSLSVAWGVMAPVENLVLEYRAKGEDEWRYAPPPPWSPDMLNYRGSILDLKEDTDYEVRVMVDGKVRSTGMARTWKSVVKVAREVTIDPAATEFPLTISERGCAEGWIRYRVKPGTELVNPTAKITVFFTNAEYVVFADSVIRGGLGAAAIQVVDSRHVRIVNCDISRFGNDRVEPRYDQLGGLFGPWNAGKRRYHPGNHCGGIDIAGGAQAVTVERCWIHDANSRAHSWRYSHPYGPMAVRFRDPEGNFVVRWCDFTGSDNHRWDDGIGGGNDFKEFGLLRRDSDVEGNFIAFANDDCVEIDGGQQNIRVMRNRFEGGFMGLSVQGCTVGPSYSYDNAFTGCGEEFGKIGAPVKTSGVDLFGWNPHVFIFGNHFLFGDAERPVSTNKTTAVFHLENNDYAATPSAGWMAAYPRRPLPWTLDTGRIDGVKVAKGKVTPEAVAFTLTCPAGDYASPFTVAKNFDSDWFEVLPASGVIRGGEQIKFTVKFIAGRMSDRRHKRAAFLVRTPEGLSRPVTVYAKTDYMPPFKAEKSGETALYAEFDANHPLKEYVFDVPRAGRYYFMLRGTCRAPKERVSIMASVDGSESEKAPLMFADYPTWTILAPSGTYMSFIRFYDLKPGRHTLKLTGGKMLEHVTLEGLVLTDSPGSFEPR